MANSSSPAPTSKGAPPSGQLPKRRSRIVFRRLHPLIQLVLLVLLVLLSFMLLYGLLLLPNLLGIR